MEPETQDMLREVRHTQHSTPDEETAAVVDVSYDIRDQPVHDPGLDHQHYTQHDVIPPQYMQHAQPPPSQHQAQFMGQYPPPGAGQVSPNHPIPGSFPQKDARMYHQQQPQYPPGTVVYQASGPYPQPGSSPYNQASGAQLYPGYGSTQPMTVTPGPQSNTGSVTFVNPIVADEKVPSDYMCLSIIACLCLFCPTGCAAIYFSSQTRDSIQEGNLVEAKARSKTTLKLIKISLVLFIIGGVIGLLWKFVFASMFNRSNETIYDYSG